MSCQGTLKSAVHQEVSYTREAKHACLRLSFQFTGMVQTNVLGYRHGLDKALKLQALYILSYEGISTI